VALVLRNKHGSSISGKTVLRLMREEGRRCLVRRKKYSSYKGEVGLAAANTLDRNFAVATPNAKWVTDITEFKVCERKIYFSPMIDLYNGEVIAYEVNTSPTLKLVTGMLTKAFAGLDQIQRPMIHSDQGWHYRHMLYQKSLRDRGIEQSMSRKGNCLDNAVAENFFGHFKEEFLRQRKFSSLKEFEKELATYIHWFNHERIKVKLKGLSPVQYRTQSFANLIPTPN
jgi:putative transposase